MSDMEHNKGRLIRTGIDLELYDEDAIEELYENDIVIIDGEAYKVEWGVEDGSIGTDTWHYDALGRVEQVMVVGTIMADEPSQDDRTLLSHGDIARCRAYDQKLKDKHGHVEILKNE